MWGLTPVPAWRSIQATVFVTRSFDKVNGTVDAALPDGSGGFYIAGSFTRVGSAARSGVVHLLSSGSVDPAFTANADGEVTALARSGGRLYLGGLFYSVNGVGRTHVAAVDSSSGAVDPNFQANASQSVHALALAGSRLFVGGDNFMPINGAGPESRSMRSTRRPGRSTVRLLTPATPASGRCRRRAPAVHGRRHADHRRLDACGWPGGNQSEDGRDDAAMLPPGGGGVFALAASATRLYAGSYFFISNSNPTTRLAAFNLADNSLVAGFQPNPDNDVHALTLSGNTLYAGGDFTQIAGGSGGRVRALDATTGALIPGFDPDPNARVNAVAVSASHVFVGGQFVIVGGVARSNVAALNAATGALDPGFTANANGEVRALALQGSQLYLGGSFSAVNGLGEGRVASVDTTSGAVADGFHGDTSNGSDQVNSLVASSGRLYAGGSFAGIGRLSRSNTASLFLDSGSADPGFRTDTDQPVKALALGDGHLFLAGGFTSVNGDATRHKLAAVDPVTGTPAAGFGSPRTDSGTQDSLATLPGKVYLGGAFTTINDSFPRNGAAAFDSGNAVPSAWDAAPGGGTVDVAALAPAGSELAIGGEFTTLAGGLRHELGAVDPDRPRRSTLASTPASTPRSADSRAPRPKALRRRGLPQLGSRPTASFRRIQ